MHPQVKKVVPIIALVIVVLIALYGYQGLQHLENADQRTYTNPTYGVEFRYPDTYVLSEPFVSTSTSTDPQAQLIPTFMITLIDKKDYDALQTADAPGEGPPAITFQVYNNMNSLPLEQWIAENPASNFRLGSRQMQRGTLDGVEARMYAWSGLYEGQTVAISRDTHIYLFSVYTFAPADPISQVFENVLRSVELD